MELYLGVINLRLISGLILISKSVGDVGGLNLIGGCVATGASDITKVAPEQGLTFLKVLFLKGSQAPTTHEILNCTSFVGSGLGTAGTT